jgi:hypothetical protein
MESWQTGCRRRREAAVLLMPLLRRGRGVAAECKEEERGFWSAARQLRVEV